MANEMISFRHSNGNDDFKINEETNRTPLNGIVNPVCLRIKQIRKRKNDIECLQPTDWKGCPIDRDMCIFNIIR